MADIELVRTAPQRSKISREAALALAERKKAARRVRTRRIRRMVAALSAAAFIGPFGVIYTQMAAGRDPATGATQQVATKVSTALSQASSASSAGTKRAAAAEKAAARKAAAAKKAAAAQTTTASTTTASTTTASTTSGSTQSATTSPAPVTTQQS